MKNKNLNDDQELSLFDGQDEEILGVSSEDEETVSEPEVNEDAESAEGSTVLSDNNDVALTDDPYYDEAEVVTTDNDADDFVYDYEDDDDDDYLDDSDSYSDNAVTEETAVSAPESELPDDTEKKPEQNKEEKPRRIDSIFDFIELFVFTLAAVFILTSFFFKFSTVSGDSMQNTLQSGERLVLRSFLYNPKPGDVVVVDDRSLDAPMVKRIIAVGGQRVKVTHNAIYVDGVKLEEDYVYTSTTPYYHYSVVCPEVLEKYLKGYQEGVYYEIEIPKNEIFVMGDHRDISKDSRSIGTLHEDSVLGKVVLRFFPFDQFGKVD